VVYPYHAAEIQHPAIPYDVTQSSLWKLLITKAIPLLNHNIYEDCSFVSRRALAISNISEPKNLLKIVQFIDYARNFPQVEVANFIIITYPVENPEEHGMDQVERADEIARHAEEARALAARFVTSNRQQDFARSNSIENSAGETPMAQHHNAHHSAFESVSNAFRQSSTSFSREDMTTLTLHAPRCYTPTWQIRVVVSLLNLPYLEYQTFTHSQYRETRHVTEALQLRAKRTEFAESIKGIWARFGVVYVRGLESDVRRLLQPNPVGMLPQKHLTWAPRSQQIFHITGWVKVRVGPYKGDVGIVFDIPETHDLADPWTILLVPRLRSVTAPKRNRGHQSRPLQGLLNKETAVSQSTSFRGMSEEDERRLRDRLAPLKRNVLIRYKTDIYFNGLIVKEVPRLQLLVDARPSEVELGFFREALSSSSADGVQAREIQDALFSEQQLPPTPFDLHNQDRVQVLDPILQGAIGRIVAVEGDIAKVALESSPSNGLLPSQEYSVSVTKLRFAFVVGDNVLVKAGPHAGTVGMVVDVTERQLTIHCVAVSMAGPKVVLFLNQLII
jgi:hypothetical protein